MVLNSLRAVVAFLTIFPVRAGGQDSLQTAAANMPLFPLVGLAIGAIGGLAGLFFATLLPPMVAAMLTLGVLLLVTGLHHTDGLLDLGDGLMRRGTKEEKLQAMRDTMTGAGGFGLGLIVLLTTGFSIASLPVMSIPLAVASAETTAKSSMVMAASIGTSAGQGLNRPFIEAMHGDHRVVRTALPSIFALLIGYVSAELVGLVGVAAGFVAAWLLVKLSHNHFGGLTGDVLGAINDISRMVTLLVLIGGMR